MSRSTRHPDLHDALRQFARTVHERLHALSDGEPEDQLRGPIETLFETIAAIQGERLRLVGETRVPGGVGRPDYAVEREDLLYGHLELKEPGKGADPTRFRGHDRRQAERFKALPNLIYTDGTAWALHRGGERVRACSLSGDIAADGAEAVGPDDADQLLELIRDFLAWSPLVPASARGVAEWLAPLCRILRDDVRDAMAAQQDSPIQRLARDWRTTLFPNADDDRFADAYAQTVTFALLLARSEGGRTLRLDDAVGKLRADHLLLSRALQVLTDAVRDANLGSAVRLLQRVINEIPDAVFARRADHDPWLYFYEFFLAAYDEKLRKDAGAYYTPVEVVRAQVRLVDRLLTDRLGKRLGFADPDVVTLDPAVGTGAYPLGVIEHALRRVRDEQGEGAVAGHASRLGANVYGFEIMVGPYAVSELRVTRAILDAGGTLPAGEPRIILADTLSAPHARPLQAGVFYEPLAKQREAALRVKSAVPVLVCIGNPPYDRHEGIRGVDEQDFASTGGWVRWGDPLADAGRGPGGRPLSDREVQTRRQANSILHRAFIQPVLDAGHGGDLKNLYNLYVYFLRWVLWKVFEQSLDNRRAGPGVVSFITASSYLDGDAFLGVRRHLRRLCDELWIIDLGGEGRGTRQSDNVFAIQTPVAILIAFREGAPRYDTPARVRYTRIDGARAEKLAALDAIRDFEGPGGLTWEDCPADWDAPFRPGGRGAYFDWPLLTDLMPWQQSGVMIGRTWPESTSQSVLQKRWNTLVHTSPPERVLLFVERPSGRKIADTPPNLLDRSSRTIPISRVQRTTPPEPIRQYAFRSFDRHFLITDSRLIDRPGPSLWIALERQVFLASTVKFPLDRGPAMTATACLPDRHYFAGRGGKDILPLFRDAAATQPNILPGLLDILSTAYGRAVSPEDFAAYVYGVLAQPEFTGRFHDELATREIRVPLTKDGALFHRVAAHGRRLLWLHTYGERLTGQGRPKGRVPSGAARCERAVPESPDKYPESFAYDEATKTLRVGEGAFAPVAPEVFGFEVSGLKVVESWLGYRMKEGKGRKSSPLDDIRPERWTAEFTTELLELLWVLEATVADYPAQKALLDEVVGGELFRADELPEVPPEARRAPRADDGDEGLFGPEGDDEDD